MKLSTRSRWIVAAVFILVGAVWLGQGLGLFRGSSFMDGSAVWAIIGAGLVVLGLVIAWSAIRSRPTA